MAEFLRYLTDEDRRCLLAAARRVVYEPDEVILQEGERREAIFLLVSGEARVERHHMDYTVEVARLGPGEIFGEMGFVEGFEASASVVAQTRCEVDVVEADHVRELIESDPAFYGRFYQSLAHILSRRLRETTDIGIAEYAWGGWNVDQGPAVDAAPGWRGGSPLRDEAPLE